MIVKEIEEDNKKKFIVKELSCNGDRATLTTTVDAHCV